MKRHLLTVLRCSSILCWKASAELKMCSRQVHFLELCRVSFYLPIKVQYKLNLCVDANININIHLMMYKYEHKYKQHKYMNLRVCVYIYAQTYTDVHMGTNVCAYTYIHIHMCVAYGCIVMSSVLQGLSTGAAKLCWCAWLDLSLS